MARSLYICYFGMREPLVQTQVLPYIREIMKDGVRFTLLTFEPKRGPEDIAEFQAIKKQLDAEGIDWQWLPYHKRPSVPATFYDILNGIRFVVKLGRKRTFDVFHVRGHIPAPIGAIAKSILGGKLLFDIRGFMPEEYTDAGVWKESGFIFGAVKRLEKWLMAKSDGFIVLTERARDILFPEAEPQGDGGWATAPSDFNSAHNSRSNSRPVEVIPCCVDLNRFESVNDLARKSIRSDLRIDDRKVITYVGSFGGWYLTDEMIGFFAAARKSDPKTFALILTQRDKEQIIDRFRSEGFSDQDFFIESVSPADVQRYLAASDITISFIKACYSKLSSSPTKIAEYLAAGLPVIANAGVGDVDLLITNENVGVITDDFSEQAYLEALKKIEKLTAESGFSEHCREVARRNFDLETVGGERYRRIYRRLLSTK